MRPLPSLRCLQFSPSLISCKHRSSIPQSWQILCRKAARMRLSSFSLLSSRPNICNEFPGPQMEYTVLSTLYSPIPIRSPLKIRYPSPRVRLNTRGSPDLSKRSMSFLPVSSLHTKYLVLDGRLSRNVRSSIASSVTTAIS
jgi:hypothetical protein